MKAWQREDGKPISMMGAGWIFCLVSVCLLWFGGAAQAGGLPQDARAALLSGDWEKVLERLETAQSDLTDVSCRMVAAHACLACNHNNKALLTFLAFDKSQLAEWKSWTETLCDSAEGNSVANYLRGDARARCGDFVGAETALTAALRADPKFALARVARGTLYALEDRKDEAYLDLVEATKADPKLAHAQASLGALEVIAENAEGAFSAYSEALALDPAFSLAYNGRGCALYGLGKPDEAFLDFEMAQTLNPALVVSAANQTFVIALVARMVDRISPRLSKPGTYVTSRSETIAVAGLEGPSHGQTRADYSAMNDDELRTTYETKGWKQVDADLARQQGDLLKEMVAAKERMVVSDGRIQQIVKFREGLEWAKLVVDAAGGAKSLASGTLAGFVSFSAGWTVKSAGGLAIDHSTLPKPLKDASKIVLESLEKGGKVDPLSATVEGVRQRMDDALPNMDKFSANACRTVGLKSLKIGELFRQRRVLMELELGKSLVAGTISASGKNTSQGMAAQVVGVSFSGTQPWSQMAELLKDVSSRQENDRPITIVAQDLVRGYGFGRMLNNCGIAAIVAPPMSEDQLSRLGHLADIDHVVLFSRDAGDMARKLLQPVGIDSASSASRHDAANYLGVTIHAQNFSYPDRSGRTQTLPLPPSCYDKSHESWSYLKPFDPKGHEGGVRTEDLDWVFVDHGDWPVMAFFTLCYQPPAR